MAKRNIIFSKQHFKNKKINKIEKNIEKQIDKAVFIKENEKSGTNFILSKRRIKIDLVNFWYGYKENDYYIIDTTTNCLKQIGYTPIFADSSEEECDIIFSSVFGNNITAIGKPKKILFNLENWKPQFKYDYSISNFLDDETNTYVPTWQFYCLKLHYTFKRDKFEKDKFMTFIANNQYMGDLASLRYEIATELNNNYKHVDFCGSLGNNIGYRLPYEMDKTIEFHKPYKFNLCFENSTSDENSNYITEKLFNAFEYNTVPVYAGSDKIEELINPKAFINCNGKSKEEIIDIIKYYDNNDEAYYNMLSEPIFRTKELQERDWEEYIYNRLIEAFRKIL